MVDGINSAKGIQQQQAGQTSGKPDVDLGSIGEAAVEGGIKGAVEGQEE